MGADFLATLRQDFDLAGTKLGLTLRSYAKRINVHPSTLSLVLNGKLKISDRRALEIVDRLSLVEPSVVSDLKVSLGGPIASSHRRIAEDHGELMSDWRFLAVLHQFELPEERRSARAIALHLGLDEAAVGTIIERLAELGYLEGETVLRMTDKNLFGGNGQANDLVKRHHLANLEVAELALDSIPASERDFTSYTFAASAAQFTEIKILVRKLYSQIGAMTAAGENKDEIYRVTIMNFPLRFKKPENH